MHNFDDESDDESGDKNKVDKDERGAYLSERAAKKAEKRRAYDLMRSEKKRAYNIEYYNRPEVSAKRKLKAQQRLTEKAGVDNRSEMLEKPDHKQKQKREDRSAYYREYNANRRKRNVAAESAYHAQYRIDHADARREYNRRHYAQFKPIRQQWDIDHPCKHCGKIWLKSSEAGLRKKCCQNGLLWNDLACELVLGPLPYELDKGFYSTHFVKSSNQYNNILSLGAVGIENDKEAPGWDRIVGDHAVRLSGRTYHYIPASNTRGGIQYFLHDGRSQELTAHGREQDVDVPTLERLFEYMQHQNVLCRSYATIGSMADFEIRRQQGNDPAQAVSQAQLNQLIPQLSRATVEFDVSSISIDRISGNHILRVKPKGSREMSKIPCDSELFEPIAYPILFPHGESGWGNSFRVGKLDNGSPCLKINFLDYLASRMLMPERYLNDYARNMDASPEELADPHFGKFGKICTQIDTGRPFFNPTNRFERFSRLGQTYLVDQMSRAIDYRMSYIRRHQDHIFGGERRSSNLADASDDEEERIVEPNIAMQDILDARQDGAASSRSRFNTASRMSLSTRAQLSSSLERQSYSSGISTTMISSRSQPTSRAARVSAPRSLPCPATMDQSTPLTTARPQVFDPSSKASFLGDNVCGSKRHLKKQAVNGLHIVSNFGSSHIFATLTCNKNWPEFKEVLWPDSDVFDMPALVAEVFHARLQAFLHNLKHGKYFGEDTTVFIIRVIEYQERGLPHAHIVFRLKKAGDTIKADLDRLESAYAQLSPEEKLEVPPPTYDDAAALWVDEHISAELPIDPRLPEHRQRYGDTYEESIEFQEDLRLFLTISKFHTHTHSGNHLVNGCLDKNGICKKGFMKTIVRDKTTFSKDGFPEYRRRSLDDLNIVPYNRLCSLDWDGHLNVEFSGLTYTVLYLYKYLFKGPSKIQLTLITPPRPGVLPLHPEDEVGRYIRGRRLCSMDAMWRLLGFDNYPKSEPAVIGVKVRSQQFVNDYEEKQLLLDIVAYFARPDDLAGMLYADCFKHFRVVRVRPSDTWIASHSPTDLYDLPVLGNRFGKPAFLIKRDPRNPVLCRLHTVSYTSGDLWYARLLLKLFPFRNFEHMKTYQGDHYATFQEAAIARGVANDAAECEECFTLAAMDEGRTARELRFLFVTMAINAMPVMVVYNKKNLRDLMLEREWIIDPLNTPDNRIAYDRLLADLRHRLAEHGKTNEDYGLAEPASTQTEIERYERRFGDIAEQSQLYQHLSITKRLNTQQQRVFDSIAAAVTSQTKEAPGTFLTLEGSGGCGKTELAKQLIAFIRSTPLPGSAKARSVHVVCSTALGAQNYAQGECSTAHSFFCLPVEEEFDKELDDEEGISCNAAAKPDRYALIQAADVIVWDEAMANHRECLEAVLKTFDNFRGKVLLLMFDAKQMLPVIPGGDHLDIVKACLFSSPHWTSFRRHLLTENMRLLRIADPVEQELQMKYDMMIRAIGENKPLQRLVLEEETLEGWQPSATTKSFILTGIPQDNIINSEIDPTSFDKAIAWLYPDGYNPEHAARNVVLATTNVNVDEWNERIAIINPAFEHPPLKSSDTFTDVDDLHGHLKNMISDAVLEQYNNSDVPPHILRIKVNDVCLIMRNLNVHDGVTNNTRVRILHITTKYIACQTIGDNPVRIVLPRIRFNFRLPWGQSFMMTRLQFPLRRAFALSVHKSQGQTLERGLIDARGGFFAHGHLYVGMSRVTRYDKIALFVNRSQLYTDLCPQQSKEMCLHLKPLLQNIVYPEAISEIQTLTQAYNAEQTDQESNTGGH